MAGEREKTEASSWTKFRLLMWKNLLQQWRHYIKTAVELLIPVLLMCLCLYLRSAARPHFVNTVEHSGYPANSLVFSNNILYGMNKTQWSVAYSPKNEILENVVRKAVATFTSCADADHHSIGITAYRKSSDLRNIYDQEESTRKVIAAIEFDDSLYGVSSLPSDMSYELRFPEKQRKYSFFKRSGGTWHTDSVLPGSKESISGNVVVDPDYVAEMFIALQNMISLELISTMTGKKLTDFSVDIQQYPYPSYVEDRMTDRMYGIMLPILIVISFCYMTVNLVRAITVEKELQLKEHMKIMGIPSWLHWTAWFTKQIIYKLFAAIFIIVIFKRTYSFSSESGSSGFDSSEFSSFKSSSPELSFSVFTKTPSSVLFFFLMLYFICIILFCFMVSGFFSKASTAALSAGVIWVLTFVPSTVLTINSNFSATTLAFTCLSINSAMAYGVQLLLNAEITEGMQWSEFMASESNIGSRLTFGHVIIMLIIDCVLYMLIALYLEQVLPGPYGTPKPWYFFLKKQFWVTGNKRHDTNIIENTEDVVKESDPSGLPVGVHINKLCKIFGKDQIAVNNLSLNIYDDQITVLLGHNGAGKSTTISMLTGNLEISSGSVTVAGFDITEQLSAARSHIGLCPQHNVLFNDLTVREHLEFFSRLKGFTGKKLDNELNSLISKLELQDKRDQLAVGLSGGQKRRLAAGIAMCGAAKLILLDEPTSGMDPAARRGFWDLLQKEKKGRSMILTTHFMDEADILGDRIAIMARGRLQCVGSPYFLKKHYGVGYTLVVVKDEGFQLTACTSLINKHIPRTAVKEDRGTEVTYSLPNEYSHVFEAMLVELESNTVNIRFKNYGLETTTLEDVFMMVGSDNMVPKTGMGDSITASVESSNESLLGKMEMGTNESLKGPRLILQHMLAIWLKLWLIWTRSWRIMLIQVLLPLLVIIASLTSTFEPSTPETTIHRRKLSLSEGYESTQTLLFDGSNTTSSTGFHAREAYESMFKSSGIPSMDITVVQEQSIETFYLAKVKKLRNKILIGATFVNKRAIAWYSASGYHTAATSLAAVHSALLKSMKPDANLNVFNHPLEATYEYNESIDDHFGIIVKEIIFHLLFQLNIGLCLGIVSAVFIMFYIKERISRAKLLQKAAGIQPAVMWGSAAVFDWLWFCIICTIIIIVCRIFNPKELSSDLGRIYFCMMMYGAAMLPVNYVMSYLFKRPTVGFVTMFFINLAVVVASLIVGIMDLEEDLYNKNMEETLKTAHDIMDGILQLYPMHCLVACVRILLRRATLERICLEGCRTVVNSTMSNAYECTTQELCEKGVKKCCITDSPLLQWNKPGVAHYTTMMILTTCILWALLMVAEYRLLHKVFNEVYNQIFNRSRKAPPLVVSTMDSDVVDEMRHVELVSRGTNNALVAKGLTKYYGNLLAVNQISFSVGESEVFGLLGVNGAGKTTTFKMLMGDESISSGDALVGGHSVKTNITKVHQNIGYCPQFDALFEELTGRETLRLFSMLRGCRPGSSGQAEALAKALGFHEHLDKKVGHFSGGNKRKLSTAIALLGRTRLVFVDEPTTGVDPAAKRQVWNAIQGARRGGRGVVLTSHSMEECEALCSRLTIMVNGRFQCLGTPQHLKNKFSEGFTLTIKIKANENSTPVEKTIENVKVYIEVNFKKVKLMEEYKEKCEGLLVYYLLDRSVPWSRLFGTMETAKRQWDIEDYSISQASLEQIFLQFTKYKQQ